MTMWNGGSGWGWCDTFTHFPSTAILWAVVLTGVAVAVGFAIGHRNDSAARATPGLARPKRAATARIPRNDTDSDEFWRRLM
jgi:hypothetical protein